MLFLNSANTLHEGTPDSRIPIRHKRMATVLQPQQRLLLLLQKSTARAKRRWTSTQQATHLKDAPVAPPPLQRGSRLRRGRKGGTVLNIKAHHGQGWYPSRRVPTIHAPCGSFRNLHSFQQRAEREIGTAAHAIPGLCNELILRAQTTHWKERRPAHMHKEAGAAAAGRGSLVVSWRRLCTMHIQDEKLQQGGSD
jgi:hypothetical protein